MGKPRIAIAGIALVIAGCGTASVEKASGPEAVLLPNDPAFSLDAVRQVEGLTVYLDEGAQVAYTEGTEADCDELLEAAVVGAGGPLDGYAPYCVTMAWNR